MVVLRVQSVAESRQQILPQLRWRLCNSITALVHGMGVISASVAECSTTAVASWRPWPEEQTSADAKSPQATAAKGQPRPPPVSESWLAPFSNGHHVHALAGGQRSPSSTADAATAAGHTPERAYDAPSGVCGARADNASGARRNGCEGRRSREQAPPQCIERPKSSFF